MKIYRCPFGKAEIYYIPDKKRRHLLDGVFCFI